MDRIGLSIVVPAYNEATSIGQVLDNLWEVMEDTAFDYRILVVDDGSDDATGSVAKANGFRVLHHPENRGYGAAFKTGARYAAHDLIASTDADGTYPNERLPELSCLAVDGKYDRAVGAPTGQKVHAPLLRRPAKWALSRLPNHLARTTIPSLNSGPRVFRKDATIEFGRFLPSTFSFATTLTVALLTNYYSVHYVPISYHKRVGRSKINPIWDTLNIRGLIVRTAM